VSANDVHIRDAKQLGAFVRAVRKAQHLRQDEVGRFSHSFIGDLEDGKPTAQMGKVIEVLCELGVKLRLELPPGTNLKQFDRYIRESSMTSRSSKDQSR
jgi:transcriptional regulator with XRE-family HTH domain